MNKRQDIVASNTLYCPCCKKYYMATDDPNYKMRIDNYRLKICEDCYQAQEENNPR